MPVKLRLFNPRLFVRALRALERIANATEDLRDGYYKTNGLLGSVRIADSPVDASDNTDDSLVTYTTNADTQEWQKADERTRRTGLPTPHSSLY